MIISVFKENNNIFKLSKLSMETTMAASLNFLTANINSYEIQYFIG